MFHIRKLRTREVESFAWVTHSRPEFKTRSFWLVARLIPDPEGLRDLALAPYRGKQALVTLSRASWKDLEAAAAYQIFDMFEDWGRSLTVKHLRSSCWHEISDGIKNKVHHHWSQTSPSNGKGISSTAVSHQGLTRLNPPLWSWAKGRGEPPGLSTVSRVTGTGECGHLADCGQRSWCVPISVI